MAVRDFLDDMQTLLVANIVDATFFPGGLVFSTNLFAGTMPEAPDEVTTIYEGTGLQPNAIGNTSTPNFQVITRASDYQQARGKIEVIYNFLKPIGDEQQDVAPGGLVVAGTTYLRFQAIQEPFPLGKDESGRHQFAQNYFVTYYRS